MARVSSSDEKSVAVRFDLVVEGGDMNLNNFFTLSFITVTSQVQSAFLQKWIVGKKIAKMEK